MSVEITAEKVKLCTSNMIASGKVINTKLIEVYEKVGEIRPYWHGSTYYNNLVKSFMAPGMKDALEAIVKNLIVNTSNTIIGTTQEICDGYTRMSGGDNKVTLDSGSVQPLPTLDSTTVETQYNFDENGILKKQEEIEVLFKDIDTELTHYSTLVPGPDAWTSTSASGAYRNAINQVREAIAASLNNIRQNFTTHMEEQRQHVASGEANLTI